MASKKKQDQGLQFSRRFTKEGVTPFDLFEYDYRTSIIRNPSGEIVFEMNNVEVLMQLLQFQDLIQALFIVLLIMMMLLLLGQLIIRLISMEILY